jgi:mRNA-degrading endonuclease RelE of RelBE toxin-antitoxin system
MINFDVLPRFEKEVKTRKKKYPNIKKDILNLSSTLSENPTKGILIKNNLYKIRIKNSDNNSGKSGGYRVIYYYINQDNYICYFSIFSKSKTENLTDIELDELFKEYELRI